MNTKVCSKCGEDKSINEFYRDKRKKDGLYPHCKQCHNAITTRYAQSDKGKQIQKDYWLSDEARDRQRKRAKKYRQKDEVKAHRKIKMRQLYPSIYSRQRGTPMRGARWTISNAVRRGDMPPAKTLKCYDCGKPANEYHHHYGYARAQWRNVIPLCEECHGIAHRK